MAQTGTRERDCYDVLGLERGADAASIKRAYRDLARRYHPDTSTAPDADERFREITEAYAVLSGQTSKVLYDVLGHRTRSRRHDEPELDRRRLIGELRVDFVEAERGSWRSVTYARPTTCAECGGTGASPDGVETACRSCGGEGNRTRSTLVGDREILEVERCAECAGTGVAVGPACESCAGAGTVTVEDRGIVEVPAGVRDGTPVPIAARDGDETDAYLLVRIGPRLDDHAVIRYAAVAGLVLAIALLVVLLAT